MVALPAALVADVYHGERTCASVLYCSFQHEGIRCVYTGRRNAEHVARDLEWWRVSAISRGFADERTSFGVYELRTAMESLIEPGSQISVIIPALNIFNC